MKLALECFGHRFYSESGNLVTPLYVELTDDIARNEWNNANHTWWEHLAGDVWRTLEFSEE